MAATGIIRLEIGQKVNGFTVKKKLGEGAFGAVYSVTDEKGNTHAIKAEINTEAFPLLKLELLVMMKLRDAKAYHMPDLIDKGVFANFNYIVMKLLGKSMQEAKKTGPNGHCSLGTAISASIQCLEALEELHWAGFLHRDVKPGNFAVGRREFKELRKIYVLDFGMCRRYVDEKNTMLPPRKKAQFRGTPRYAAISSHENKEHCRKDDVESWFYMLVDFTNAKLPWKTVTEIKETGECKKNSRNEPLLTEFMTGCPKEEYHTILKHIDGLDFFQAPDYAMIYRTLRETLKKSKEPEFPYDWENEKNLTAKDE